MRFKIYRQFGALNSQPLFDAFTAGLIKLGHTVVDNNEDCVVIWSVLWQGRMLGNKQVYDAALKNNIPVMILEVGNLIRGVSWRLSLNNINGLGTFASHGNLDQKRPEKLRIFLKDYKKDRREEILICTQHHSSLQWHDQPPIETWVEKTVKRIRKYSNRPIVVRPHPRCPTHINLPEIVVQQPNLVQGTYDNFDIDYNYHCVINHSSGPTILAAIEGIPIICSDSSLAYEISNRYQNLENLEYPDRSEWFLKLCHTEWLLEEFGEGIPQSRLIPLIKT